MIIVRLIGGLGNQLFQYAVARHIAEIHGAVLKIDISEYTTYKLQKYSLSHFNIQENLASNEEIKALAVRKEGILNRSLRRAFHRPLKLPPTHIKEKKLFHFDPRILNLPDGVYLEGSWQSEKYFSGIESIIRKEFTMKTPPVGKNKELKEQIISCESVGVHIRRGDYITNPNTSRVHGTVDLDYYHRCVKHITERIKHPHFFIFSDDPDWVHDNLKFSHPTTFIDHNRKNTDYEDLRLMSQCHHNIIANSTFSWWGAWLNENFEKIVMAPKSWFKSREYDTRDLIPDKWIKN